MTEHNDWQPDRQAAWELLCEYTESESLRKHAMCVEAAMRAYAGKYQEDEDLWGVVGLLHDFDYERFPTEEQHPLEGSKILESRGYPKFVRDTIMSHVVSTGVVRDTQIAKTLFACDELTGFLTACALVRPDKDILGVKPKSVKKKLKDKRFAAAVSREDIATGVEELGVELGEHIIFVAQAMGNVADQLGLAGPGAATE